MDKITCLLPGGFVDKDKVVHQDAELIPLSGREEEMLADRKEPASAALVTGYLESLCSAYWYHQPNIWGCGAQPPRCG